MMKKKSLKRENLPEITFTTENKKGKGKMNNQDKRAIWLDEMDMEILGGFVAELLDRKELDYYQVDILEDVLNQITEEEKGK